MYAIAFDLVVADTEEHHPKGVTQAYSDIGAILSQHGFRWVHGSLYVTENEDMAYLFLAISKLFVSRIGFQNRSAIFAPFASSNGRISRM